MENPKIREKEDDHDVGSGSDRISRLPDPLLHHILCFLSYKKAVQTSVLSKSWRHLGPTRSVIDFRRFCVTCSHVSGIKVVCENCFQGNREAFIPALEKTFQRYHHHNLYPHELHLHMMYLDPQSTSVLRKWIPIFINPDRHVTTFRLSSVFGSYFNVPSVVFKAESLRELSLGTCTLNKVKSIDNFLFKNLQKLSLSYVYISDEALEKLISGCPMVECVVLSSCHGFKTINIGIKNRYLNYFAVSSYSKRNIIAPSIEIDAPILESLRIEGRSNWFPNNTHNIYFHRLKTLFLSQVNLPTDSFDNFSCNNFPCLEELSLLECCGFEEINISSRSIKRLIINQSSSLSIKEVAIEVPNIRYFEFSFKYFPTTLSLVTTSREWKSHLNFHHYCGYVYGNNDYGLRRILKLFDLVKKLSQSQISLTLSEPSYFRIYIKKIEWDFDDHPIVVEHLDLKISSFCPDSLASYLNALFRIFRPRYTNAVRVHHNDDEEVTKFLWKTLIHERKKTEYGWENYLEEVSIEVSDEKGEVWHHVQWTCLPKWSKDQKIRFRLKWSD